MALVNISEKEYGALVDAILTLHGSGERATALILDGFAQKANTSLTKHKYRGLAQWTAGGKPFQADSPLTTAAKVRLGLQSQPQQVAE